MLIYANILIYLHKQAHTVSENLRTSNRNFAPIANIQGGENVQQIAITAKLSEENKSSKLSRIYLGVKNKYLDSLFNMAPLTSITCWISPLKLPTAAWSFSWGILAHAFSQETLSNFPLLGRHFALSNSWYTSLQRHKQLTLVLSAVFFKQTFPRDRAQL